MRRRHLAAVAVVSALLLSGCAPQYATPDERSRSFGSDVAEELKNVETQPDELRVGASYDGITIDAQLGTMSPADSRAFIEEALPIIQDSPLGAMPVRFVFRHEDARSGGGGLEWRGYDPAQAERYFAAVELWLDVLADPGVELKERFEIEGSYFYGSVGVLDDRDVQAYRDDLVVALERAGFAEPFMTVSAPQPE